MILPWGDAGKIRSCGKAGGGHGPPPRFILCGRMGPPGVSHLVPRRGSPILCPAGAAYIFVCHISYRILPVHTLAGG